MELSNFSNAGLPIGAGERSYSSLYGISDFWTIIFEDSAKTDLLMEANTQKLSDIYSHFLQLTSSICLQDIQVTTSQQLKLVILGESDLVPNAINTYYLPTEVVDANYIANRPLLPTSLLEDNVHYHISADGTQISFYAPLIGLGFPTRTLVTGEKQYSLWFVDVKIDEQLIWKNFGHLIGIPQPETTTDSFKNFVFGLYYVYVNGPNLSLVTKGLNIALGIPLARDTETVLEIRQYLNTDQFLVITDLNSYLIPFGLAPSVAAGDVVQPSQELASWVEVKDWVNDGEWWINLQIPPTLLPYIPPGEPDRYAKAGSYADYLMRNYLKKHTFLVNVKTIDFKNLQSFEQLSDIINTVKPKYTTPIYIWTVPTADEVLIIDDSDITLRWDQFKCENLTTPINKMKRNLVTYAEVKTDIGAGIIVSGNLLTGISGWKSARADTFLDSRTRYWEITIGPSGSYSVGIGQAVSSLNNFCGSGTSSYGLLITTGSTTQKINASVPSVYGNIINVGDVIGVFYDGTTRNLSFYINGVSQGIAFNVPVASYLPMFSLNGSTTTLSTNFGYLPFSYPPGSPILYGVYTNRLDMLSRGCPLFIRSDVSWNTFEQVGCSPLINGNPRAFEGGTITGFIDSANQFRPDTREDKAWIRATMQRDSNAFRKTRSVMAFCRHNFIEDSSGTGVRINAPTTIAERVVHLYTTTQQDVANKFASLGQPIPSLDTWSFTLLKPGINSEAAINAIGINAGVTSNFNTLLLTNFNSLFFRDISASYLGNFMPPAGYVTYAPTVADVTTDDYLLFVRIYENTVAAYWVTSNIAIDAPFCYAVSETDPFTITSENTPLYRGLGPYSSYYFVRGGARLISPTSAGIDALAINVGDINGTNTSLPAGTSKIEVTFSDIPNPVPVAINRSGVVVKIRKELY